jgi:hypothetical protein
MKLNWQVHETATTLHVAAAIARGLPLSDPRIADAVATPMKALPDAIRQFGVPDEVAWDALCTHACRYTDAAHLVHIALPVTEQREDLRQQELIIALINEVGEGIRQVLPELKDELRHRSRPLHELWDARGPGFLRSLSSRTDRRLVLPDANVVVVYPILGGDGAIAPEYCAVQIEALLTNTVPELPEVVRLGWLIGQLTCHHLLKAIKATGQPRRVVALAMVPATLAAAEIVELVVCNAETVRQAIAAWQQRTTGEDPSALENTAEEVWKWWQSRHDSTPWDTALIELNDRLS